MGHHHDHSHGGHHHHGSGANKRALLISLFIITAFLIVEVIGGFLTNSLALLSDAGHMLSDSSALFLSLIAMFFAARKPSAKKTYGFYRFEILAALINGVMLVVISLVIIWEAYQRFFAPPEVASLSMMGIAFVGLLANIAAAFVLMRGDYKNNLNIRSAFLHVLGDLLGSVGAILAGLLMWKFNWYIADPIISVVVAVLIMLSAWRVTRDSVDVLMESTPASIDADQVSDALSKVEGVTSVHDLHIWTVTSGFDSLSCHLHVKDGLASYPILQEALHLLEHQFGITHSTIQIEDSSILHQELLCETGPQTSDKHEHNHSH
ncbi:cation transporter [Brevibacillus laterosporus]|uniref:Cadmium, cobalt and zinc/H(+)-K(+) antiporter CzcD n=1 Tax=Brevibacillus laterosporus LMG 15441 TaxID=1042163 RepID=A0A075R3A0_BRELA|nr:cation diffusion facilitator family transporter [Brevibacillus laterosporus]AIG25966.1 cadmium, cobalt and zinc/H(+)-K(+) antiporter CzcD [Brevibacillus laterosporus LMG 15441]RJL12980.1 cation transporter [Brevibacillus laterosporus]TPH08107.1 cation transporter [Brevibacillus laterosporus]